MDELQLLKQENEELKSKIIELEERLKKYTAPQRSKTYYETHKESDTENINQCNTLYVDTHKDSVKEQAKRYYETPHKSMYN